MGLHIGVLGAEKLAGTVTGDVLNLVHILAAAVVSVGGIALGIFICEHAAHGGEHRRRNEVLRRNKLYIAALAAKLALHGGGKLRIVIFKKFYALRHIAVHIIIPFRGKHHCYRL